MTGISGFKPGVPNVGAAQRPLNQAQQKVAGTGGYKLDVCCSTVLATKSKTGVSLQQAAGVEMTAGKAVINASLQKQNERLFATQSLPDNRGFLDLIKDHMRKPHSPQTDAAAFWKALHDSKNKGDGFF